MALVLVRLKIALQRKALTRDGGPQRAAFVAMWVLALIAGLVGGALVDRVLTTSSPGQSVVALQLVLTALLALWAVTPLLLPGVMDPMVDPRRLQAFPISRRDQVAGLLLGALIAPTALFTFLVSAGGTFAHGEALWARVSVLVLAVLFTVLCVAVSRAVQALLGDLMRARRAQDLIVIVAALVGIALFFVSQRAPQILNGSDVGENGDAAGALSWLPAGSVATAMVDVREGRWPTAAVHVVIALLTLVVALLAWAWAIGRTVRGQTGKSRSKPPDPHAARGLRLIPSGFSALPATPVVAVAAQTLRYYFFRQPRATQSAVMMPIIGAVLAHTAIQGGDLSLGAALFSVLLATALMLNVFGFDDRGFDYLMISATSFRPVLYGKVLAAILISLVALGLLVGVEAALTDAWGQAVAAVQMGLSVCLAGAGVGAVTSVTAARSQAGSGRMFARGGSALFITLGGLVTLMAITAVLIVATLALPDVPSWIVGLGLVGVSALLTWALIGWAAKRLDTDPWRVQQLLEAA